MSATTSVTDRALNWLQLSRADPSDDEASALVQELVKELQSVASKPQKITSEEQLNALPYRSLVGVDTAPYMPDRPFTPGYSYYEKYSDTEWLHLDPGDRDDGETLSPSGLLIRISSRFGACDPRIRLFYTGAEG